MVVVILGIALAGAAGALVRYGLTVLFAGIQVQGQLAGLPVGTLTANVAGCFLLGVLVGLPESSFPPQALRLALSVGFLGSMTTFSTLELEASLMLRDGRFSWAVAYVLASLVLGFLAVLAGRSASMASTISS